MFEVMAELEALCAGLSAERMSAIERRDLEAVHERMRSMIYNGDPQQFHKINEAFHGAMLCRRPQRLSGGTDGGDPGAGAAVPARPVPQSRAAGQIPRRT